MNDNGRVVVIQIGRHSLIVDRLLAKIQVGGGAFITAWNPFSRKLGVNANEHWDRELKGYLNARGIAFVEGEGCGRTGEWPPEPSILAFGISRTEASAIGRKYRQNAIVYLSRGRPPELVMLRWVR